MKLIDKEIKCDGRGDEFRLYPLGDIHMGARNCAEKQLRKHVKIICEDRNAYWFGGGDLLEAIKPQDSKRFDMNILPDWMLEGTADTIRGRLSDMLMQQVDRLCEILSPIRERCLGLIEGNHEFSIRKYHNEDVQSMLCRRLRAVNLTDEAVMRLKFKRRVAGATVIVYASHGFGGGRTAGSEPLKLQRMMDEWECADIALRGHSHTFNVLPPKPVLYLPRTKSLPDELLIRYRWAGNWGCWKYSHSVGPSTYESRAAYPARAMLTVRVDIKPFNNVSKGGKKIELGPHIELRGITL
ncbi:MAG: hypothetical protein KAS32_10860 [Candidatus Peribacteraceae bacterium]|nr:hypothetical protein [Candidatus Peribacteraceae bacterium]